MARVSDQRMWLQHEPPTLNFFVPLRENEMEFKGD
jgi:hypothetical protein